MSTEPIIVAYNGLLPLARRKPLKVTKSAWDGLTSDEQARMGERWNVKVLESSSYGFVIDSQTVNESTAGTQDGSNLGAALGQTLYIDRSLKGGNSYSATNQLAAGVTGAIVGSLLNTAPTTWYRTRYSVRVAGGSIQMADQVRSDPFRLPVSMCVEWPSLDNYDQTLCTQTADSIREKYLLP